MSTIKNKEILSKRLSDRNLITGIGILFFVIFFVSLFAVRFINSEPIDPNRRYCADCSLKRGEDVYHSLNSNTATNEIWCENCNKWHAPRDENTPATINP